MPQAARITDAVAGTTAGEHTGHVPTHSPEPFSGEISGACSGTVRINGLSAATVGSITTERLAAVGVMASPEYWVAHYKDVKNLDGLILNMATRIKVNLGGTSITTVDAALDVLTKTGVINSPDYWATAYTSLAWLDTLLLKAANALTAD